MNGTIQYTIRPYDTIWMLAQVFNTTVDSIMDLNPGIEPRNLMIGQVITIRPGFQYAPPFSNTPAGSEFSTRNMRTMPGRGTTEQTMPGSGTTEPTMPSRGTTEPTMPSRGTTEPTMPSRGTTESTMPGRGTTEPTMPGRGTTEPTMPGPGTSRPTMPGSDRMDQNRMDDRMDDDGMDDRMNREMMDHDMQDMCGYMMDLVEEFRQLWVEHTAWTAFTILSMVQSLPQAEVYTQRLLRNPVDFAEALEPFYGEEAAQKFGQLLSQHLTLAAEIVSAAIAGDNNAMTDADRRWHENADEIAATLASINPYWNQEDWMAMLYEHLDNVSMYADTLMSGDYAANVNAFDQMLDQVLDMGDMMADGIAMQFPG